MCCKCGETKPHVIMRRMTADGIEVNLWEDGAVTGALGMGLLGVPLARPKTQEAIDRARAIGYLMLGDICIHDREDLADLYAAAKRAAARDRLPGTMRRIFREIREERTRLHLVLRWHTTRANNRSEVTERWARLPADRWPGLVVFDFCGSEGSNQGRYQVWHRIHSRDKDETVSFTGIAFRTLRELFDHLDTYPHAITEKEESK